MNTIIVPPERLEAKRQERERERKEREALAGTILLDDEDEDKLYAPASPAQIKEIQK